MLESTDQLANAKFFEFYDVSFKAKDYQTIRDTLLKTTVWVTFVGSKKSPTQIFFEITKKTAKRISKKNLLKSMLPKNTAKTGNESVNVMELLSENCKICCQRTLPKLEMKANIISKKRFEDLFSLTTLSGFCDTWFFSDLRFDTFFRLFLLFVLRNSAIRPISTSFFFAVI